MTLLAHAFLNLQTPKNVVRLMSKTPLSENLSTSTKVNRPKHCSKLNDSTFTIFTDPWKGNPGLKILSEWYAKSYNCLLTHWLLMTSILFLTEAIYCNLFRCFYLTKEKYFLNFFLQFLNLDSIFTFSKKIWPF